MCFMSKILKLGTKRLNDVSWHSPQTTPVPLRDRCRYAAHPLLISGGELKKTSTLEVPWFAGMTGASASASSFL
jgi:hypothetical protein